MLGNFFIQEILQGVVEDFDGNILYTLDQLSSASIEISSDPTEITDKNGNVIRQIYRSKTGTFTATSALLSPAILAAGSGSTIKAGTVMPKIMIVPASTKINLTNEKIVVGDGTPMVSVIAVANNGANGDSYDTAALVSATALAQNDTDWELDLSQLPTADSFLVKFDRTVEGGLEIVNKATEFPKTVRLTLYAAIGDPCSDEVKAGFVYIPSFQPDPSVTISLDSENTEVDFTGQIQVDYCSCAKELYKIYLPDEAVVSTATCEE